MKKLRLSRAVGLAFMALAALGLVNLSMRPEPDNAIKAIAAAAQGVTACMVLVTGIGIFLVAGIQDRLTEIRDALNPPIERF